MHPCTGCSTRNIFLPANVCLDEPNPRHLQAAQDFLTNPVSFRDAVTGLYYLHAEKDSTIRVEYSVTFNAGHELNVRVNGRTIEDVWME